MDQIDCGVIIALPEEYQTKPALPGFESTFSVAEPAFSRGGEVFRNFTFRSTQGEQRTGIYSILHGMGPARALDVTKLMLREFDPALMINMGISGSLAEYVRLGDIVVAESSYDYTYRGKQTDAGHQLGGKPYTSFYPFFNIARQFWTTNGDDYWEWQKRCSEYLERAISPFAQEQLVRENLLVARPSLHAGPLACGNDVVASDDVRRLLLEQNRNYLAVDMESAGFLQGCYEQYFERPRVVLRAISDLADRRKDRMDGIDTGGLRAWAMGNAYEMLAILLEKVFQIDRPSRPAVQIHATVPRERQELEAKVQSLIREKYLEPRYRRVVTQTPLDLAPYDAMLRPVAQSSLIPDSADSLIRHIAGAVLASDDPYPLCVSGKPGRGKTSLMNLLYLWLRNLRSSDPALPLPLYINLKAYYGLPFQGGRPEAEKEFRRDTEPLRQLFEQYPENQAIILIDGIDEYVKVADPIENAVLELIGEYGQPRKIIGVGLNYVADRDRFRRSLFHLGNPAETVSLGEVPLDSESAPHFCGAVQRILTGGRNSKIENDALQRARAFGLGRVDLFMMAFILERIVNPRFEKLPRLADWYRVWCQSFLARSSPPVSLAEASRLAFEYAIRPPSVDHHTHVGTRAWQLLHRHRSVKDYLVANHVIETMRRVGRKEETDFSDLDYVYPHRITSFCKDIANQSKETQLEVLSGIRIVFRAGGDRAKPNACYLAGRLTNNFVRAQAAEFLLECQRKMADRVQRGSLSGDELLLARTIYISLAYLGMDEISRKASDEYLGWIMQDERWDDLNRGFHLEYYGDIEFDPDAQMSHRDPMSRPGDVAPCAQTVDNLLKRIKDHFDDPDYGPFDIEVYTLYSLVQHRHAVSPLDPLMKNRVLAEIPRLLGPKSHLSKRLRPYLQMLERNLQEDRFPVMNVGEQLYRLKSVIRQGWKRRHLTRARIESVSEHIHFCCLLALLYLPEWDGDEPQYSKSDVIGTLLIHDLAEAEIGDTAYPDVTEETKAAERRAMQYLEMCGTYLGIANMSETFRLWTDFEGRLTETARIAADIDKLENLVQLYLYERDEPVEGAAAWKQWVEEHIWTKRGQEILAIIKDKYEH